MHNMVLVEFVICTTTEIEGQHILLTYREGGDIGLLITLVPKVFYKRFWFFGLSTLGIFKILIVWFIKLSVQTF